MNHDYAAAFTAPVLTPGGTGDGDRDRSGDRGGRVSLADIAAEVAARNPTWTATEIADHLDQAGYINDLVEAGYLTEGFDLGQLLALIGQAVPAAALPAAPGLLALTASIGNIVAYLAASPRWSRPHGMPAAHGTTAVWVETTGRTLVYIPEQITPTSRAKLVVDIHVAEAQAALPGPGAHPTGSLRLGYITRLAEATRGKGVSREAADYALMWLAHLASWDLPGRFRDPARYAQVPQPAGPSLQDWRRGLPEPARAATAHLTIHQVGDDEDQTVVYDPAGEIVFDGPAHLCEAYLRGVAYGATAAAPATGT